MRRLVPRRRSRPIKGEPDIPKPPRDTRAWFLTQVEEAKNDRYPSLMHPSRMRQAGAIPALLRHRRRWNAMSQAPGGLLSLLKVFCFPPRAYRETFIRVIIFERNDEVEPELPTHILELWDAKACWTDQPSKWRCEPGENALHSPNAQVRLQLPPGMEVSEVMFKSQIYDLATDDYHYDDIIHVHRRAGNRELQSSGRLAAEVDAIESDGPNQLIELIPHAVGVLLPIITGFFYMSSLG